MDAPQMIERMEDSPIKEAGEGWLSAGVTGTLGDREMADKQRRIDYFCQREDYRTCITCASCSFGLTLKGFDQNGREEIRGRYCTAGEFPTEEGRTCNRAYRARKSRMRVLYDMTNAPQMVRELFRQQKMGTEIKAGENENLVALRPDVSGEGKYERTEHSGRSEAYVGGEGGYRRADGKRPEDGGGKIPRRLMN